MSTRYDVIVIGAGPNGLTTAALLAKAGRHVAVLERRDVVGGIAASEEFHPGYRSAGILSDTSMVRPSVVNALALERHGLKLRAHRASVLALGRGDERLFIDGDVGRAALEIGRLSPKDGERYGEYRQFLGRVGPVVRDLFTGPAVDVVDIESQSLWDLAKRAIAVRRLGKDDMHELLRVPPMCIADVLGDWFESDLLKAALALPALAGTYTAPWSPGNALNLLRHESLAGPGIDGGGASLIRALISACDDAGVDVRTGAAVRQIAVEDGGVSGVVLEDGTTLAAKAVAASCDPKTTFLDLVPTGAIEYRLEHRIENYRTRGCLTQVLLAVDRSVKFSGVGDKTIEFARTGAHLDDIERAYDPVKYGELPKAPVLDVHIPTVSDPSLAPEGHAVISILVHFTPVDLRAGWTHAARDEIADRAVSILSESVPGLTDAIVGRAVLAPPDMQARYGLHGGDPYHGEHSIDQLLVRPSPQCVGYATPLRGLFLCGSGVHPGGGLTCAPGELAAQAMTRDSDW